MAGNPFNTMNYIAYLLGAQLNRWTVSNVLAVLGQDTHYRTRHFRALIQSNNIQERHDILTFYRNLYFRNEAGYTESTQTVAFVMLRDAIHALLAVNARDLAYELVIAAAPPQVQYLEFWEQGFHQHSNGSLQGPAGSVQQMANNTVPNSSLAQQQLLPVATNIYASSFLNTRQSTLQFTPQPAVPLTPYLASQFTPYPASQHTSYPPLRPASQFMQKPASQFTYQPVSSQFTSYPPLQPAVQFTPQPAPQPTSQFPPLSGLQNSPLPSSATPATTSEMARSPTARTKLRESKKKREQKKKTPAKSTKPRRVSKQKKEPTKKTSANLGRQGVTTEVSRTLGNARAPKGSRWLCPYNVDDECMRVFTYRPDVKAHVKKCHHNGEVRWGDRVEDWKHCGHFPSAVLAARGIILRKDKDEDEDEDEDKDKEDDEESVYLSDGDHSPNQEDDDDNIGGDGGHALAQLVAVV